MKPAIQANEADIKKRFETLCLAYREEFLRGLDCRYAEAIYLNRELLHCAVVAYFDDICKFKAYSGSEYANQDKQAAFTIKWIARFKPIQIRETAETDTVLLTINAAFALFAGLLFLDPTVAGCISKEFYDQLVYMLTYREVSGKELSTIVYLLECINAGLRKV